MFELVENYTPSAKIKVIGVGGGVDVEVRVDGCRCSASARDASRRPPRLAINSPSATAINLDFSRYSS